MNWTDQPGTAAIAPEEREKRVSRLVPLELSTDRHARVRVVVRNISCYGIGARGDLDLLACERVMLHLPGGKDVGATVRWVRKGTFGLALDEPIDPESLRAKGASSLGELVPRDAQVGFLPMKPIVSSGRQGFHRSHRDEVLNGSGARGPTSVSRWTDGH